MTDSDSAESVRKHCNECGTRGELYAEGRMGCPRCENTWSVDTDDSHEPDDLRTDGGENVGYESDRKRLIQRLEEALEIQDTTEGEKTKNPTVEYCFECDEITVDGLAPEKCRDHPTVMSDGYEHGGIQSALTTLRYLRTDDIHEPDDLRTDGVESNR